MPTPFRFLADAREIASIAELTETARRAEALGIDTLVVPDHLIQQLGPIPAMAAIVAVSDRLRVSGFVLNNDLRHPAVLAQDLASIDVLSGGRLDVAIGAGWNRAEYAAIGILLRGDHNHRAVRHTGDNGGASKVHASTIRQTTP